MEKGKLRVHFYGGVGSVTGANFILESVETGTKIMVDCGLTQGFFKNGGNPNGKPFAYDPKEVQYLIVTHAHIDHIGRIPKLVKDGFRGKIYSTKNTHEIVPFMFEDALGVLNDEAEKTDSKPMYEKKDVDLALSLWESYDYHEDFSLNEEFGVFFKDAGHILGSAIVYLKHKPTSKNIVFTGDLGNSPTPLIRNAELIDDADYLIMESVYGNRNHDGKEMRRGKFRDILNRIIDRKGTLLIPVFSLEKTQVLLHEMNTLIEGGQVKSVPVFFDSPLGIKLTGVYARQFKNFNEKVQERILKGDDIFDFPKLIKTPNHSESQIIYKTEPPKIIIAGSGMSVGGRIMDHERRYLVDSKNAILFIGYQAVGSLGRRIQEGQKFLKIDGEEVKIKAEVLNVNGYSSHMDSDHLIEFVEKTAERVKKVFVVMGETESALFLVQRLRDYLEVDAVHPEEGTIWDLN